MMFEHSQYLVENTSKVAFQALGFDDTANDSWQVRIQRGDMGSGPPWQITSYMGFYRE